MRYLEFQGVSKPVMIVKIEFSARLDALEARATSVGLALRTTVI